LMRHAPTLQLLSPYPQPGRVDGRLSGHGRLGSHGSVANMPLIDTDALPR